jgi:hypothetical protein
VSASPRGIRIVCRSPWAPPAGSGLLAADARARTLRKVLVTYPHVRHILPCVISVEPGADSKVLESMARFLERQSWLVKSVIVE